MKTKQRCHQLEVTQQANSSKKDLIVTHSLHFISRNSKASRINTGRRFKPQIYLNPGPGQYEELGNVGKAVHTCSTYKTPRAKNIGTTEQRPEWSTHSRFATPGPGTYRPPSDFGYMDMKKNMKDKDFNTS